MFGMKRMGRRQYDHLYLWVIENIFQVTRELYAMEVDKILYCRWFFAYTPNKMEVFTLTLNGGDNFLAPPPDTDNGCINHRSFSLVHLRRCSSLARTLAKF